MPVFKINKNRDFTVMSNYHLRDKTISLKAKGLLSYMFSNPEDWNYSLNGLVAVCKEGKDAISSTLQELKKHGYLVIERCRGPDGKFEYTYQIFEVPFSKLPKNNNLPMVDFPDTVKPNMENPTLLNTIELIDKNDKTENYDVKHNYLTLELINMNYISSEDSSSFYFDDLFERYLKAGYSYKNLISCIHYIVPRVLSRNFIDDDGNKIENKFGYFKSAMEANFVKLNNLSKKSYDNLYDGFFDDFEL